MPGGTDALLHRAPERKTLPVAEATRVLVIEDDRDIQELLETLFREERSQLSLGLATTGAEGLRLFEEERPDLVILDIMLPDRDGFEVCRELRARASRVPILMLTARGSESDIVRGLQLGADDYVVKPFSLSVLLARVDALLRRTGRAGDAQEPPLHLGPLRLDPAQQRLWRGESEVELTPTEFRLVHALASRAGRVLPHAWLLARVWGPEYTDERAYLKTYVRRLREKLERDPADPKLILTAWGVGYRFASPEELDSQV